MSQITTHILDTGRGRPAAAVPVSLSRQTDQGWHDLAQGQTDNDGRISTLLTADTVLDAGCYRMRFATQAYFDSQQQSGFYPYVDIVFHIDGSGEHYHIPLLLSAYGYSTYRGS